MTFNPHTLDATIGGIVRLLLAYMTQQAGAPQMATGSIPPALEDKTRSKGEQIINILRTDLSQYGTAAEKAVLAAFEQHPAQEASRLATVLRDVATRTPVFRQALESLVVQLDIPPGTMD